MVVMRKQERHHVALPERALALLFTFRALLVDLTGVSMSTSLEQRVDVAGLDSASR